MTASGDAEFEHQAAYSGLATRRVVPHTISYTCDALPSKSALVSLSCGPFSAFEGPLLYTVNVFLCLLSMLAYEYIVNPRMANVHPTTILHTALHAHHVQSASLINSLCNVYISMLCIIIDIP